MSVYEEVEIRNYSPEEELQESVRSIVNGVVVKFPSFVRTYLQPHVDKLTISIVRAAQLYVEAKINQNQ